MKWQVSLRRKHPGEPYGQEAAFHLDANDENQARAQVEAWISQQRPSPTAKWEVLILAPIPTGPFQFGTITAEGFRFPCGCRMAPKGEFHSCPGHFRGGGPTAEAIVEAVTALGLLKEPRPEYTCKTCGKTEKAPPMCGDNAGRWGWPRDWESEEWQSLDPNHTTGRHDHGREVFCSRSCRGHWLIETARKFRRS